MVGIYKIGNTGDYGKLVAVVEDDPEYVQAVVEALSRVYGEQFQHRREVISV